MSPEGHGLILPVGQSFVPTAQLAAGAPPFTRRVIMGVATGSWGLQAGYQDVCARFARTLPVAATRMRLRIRNAQVDANGVNTTPVALTGVFMGTPNAASELAWQGDFTAAPTSLGLNFAATDIGTAEYLSAWFVPPGQAAGKLIGFSFGFTCASDSEIFTDKVPGWVFHGATGAGASAAAGNAAAPSGGGITPTAYTLPFDIRIEYEFVGRNQIGFFVGDSLTAGYQQTPLAATAYGHMGPDNSWPGMVSLRLGHADCNGGVPGSTSALWNLATNQCWTRFKDPTTGTIFGGTLPDYAVIWLGVNDAYQALTLATYQSNIQAIIAILQGLGVNRIYICTVTQGTMTSVNGLPTFQNGLLATALAPGATTSVAIQQTLTTATNYATSWPSAPGGGPTSGSGSGAVSSWFRGGGDIDVLYLELPSSGIAEGPLVISAASGSNVLTCTVSSFTIANNHKVGAPVLSTAEGLRQNYNHWLRQVPPGILDTFDFAKIGEAGGPPPIQRNWYYFGQTDDVHPNTPSLYAALAQAFAAGVAGM